MRTPDAESSLEARAFDPVFDSQRVFRVLLQATAQPGKLFVFPPCGENPVDAVARTLLDHEVTFCAVGADTRATEERLSSVTGARAAPAPEADFALFFGEHAGTIPTLKRGSLERPEEGATAIFAVERLSNAGPMTLGLSGPGVPDRRRVGVEGLSPSWAGETVESRAGYPLGLDLYLVDGSGQVAGLPRSTRLRVIS